MKKVILTLCLVVMASVGARAQKGETAVGVNVAYGTEVSNVGIGVKGQYNVIDHIRLEASFDYFFKNDGVSMWDINVNAHYLFPVACNGKLKVYPLLGLSYSNWVTHWGDIGGAYPLASHDDDDDSSHLSRVGVNIGAGLQYDINKHFAINLELKGQCMKDFSQFVVGIGAAYKF